MQQKVELQTPYGRVEVVALRPSTDEKLSAVLVNVGCYYTLADSGYIMVYSWQMCASHNVTYVERIGQKPVVEIFETFQGHAGEGGRSKIRCAGICLCPLASYRAAGRGGRSSLSAMARRCFGRIGLARGTALVSLSALQRNSKRRRYRRRYP